MRSIAPCKFAHKALSFQVEYFLLKRGFAFIAVVAMVTWKLTAAVLLISSWSQRVRETCIHQSFVFWLKGWISAYSHIDSRIQSKPTDVSRLREIEINLVYAIDPKKIKKQKRKEKTKTEPITWKEDWIKRSFARYKNEYQRSKTKS